MAYYHGLLTTGEIRMLPGWKTSVLAVLLTIGVSGVITKPVQGQTDGYLKNVFVYTRAEPAADASLEKAAGPFTSVPSCTLLDTRRRKDGPVLRSDVLKLVRAHVRKCGIPESSTAVSVKATVFQPTGRGNLRFYRGDLTAPSPHSAILRFQRGRTASRPVVVPVSEDCNIAVLPFVAGGGEAHVVLEVNGYYE